MAKFTCNVISYTLKRTVDLTVIVPSPTIPESFGLEGAGPSHIAPAKYPVLYLLHGMGNNHATWTGYSNVELYAEERNISVVMLSAENKAYINHPSGDQFYEFISKELPEFICAMFPVSDKQEDTYIAGLSMGGYGSFVHALSRPEQFAAYGAFSAAVAISPAFLSGAKDEPMNPNFDPHTLASRIVERGAKLPKAYIACGENDFLYEDNLKFKEQLIEMGADITWVSLPDYGHEWRFWDMQVEAFLDWIPRTDYYATRGKRKI